MEWIDFPFTMNEVEPAVLRTALRAIITVFDEAACDIAHHFNCGEIDTLAAAFISVNQTDLAYTLLRAHAEDDDAGDSHTGTDGVPLDKEALAGYITRRGLRG